MENGANQPEAARATSTCPGCGLVGAADDGPCDAYGGSSPACWATFNAVTVKDYGEYQYPEVHRLIVDAYMSQHATFATPAARRSVVVHLIGLHLVFERGMRPDVIRRTLGPIFPDKRDVPALAPKPPPGPLTIAFVLAAKDFEEHDRRARAWALAVWTSWAPHHAWIRTVAAEVLARRS